MNEAEIEELELYEEPNQQRTVIIIVAVLILSVLLLLLLLGLRNRRERPLLPVPPAIEVAALQVVDNPIRVTFTELNENPANFMGQSLIVSGEYQPLRPFPCVAPDGPNLRWSLVAENLRLEVLGQEQIVRQLQPGTPLTVQGRFVRHFGSVGCGKQPQPPQEVWYLRLTAVLEPNPLPLARNVDSFILFDPGQPTPVSGAVVVPPEEGELEPTVTPETAVPVATTPAISTPTLPPPTIPVASPTIDLVGSATPTPTATGDATASPTPTVNPSASPTITPTATATPSGSGNPTATPNNGGGGGLTTATPGPSPTPGGGYPLPINTPPPTPYGG